MFEPTGGRRDHNWKSVSEPNRLRSRSAHTHLKEGMCYHQKLQPDMNMMLRMLDVAVVVMALLSCVSVPLTLVQAQPGAKS